MPSYLSFVKGVTNGDYLPPDITRETLQQHKPLEAEGSSIDSGTRAARAREEEVRSLDEGCTSLAMASLPPNQGARPLLHLGATSCSGTTPPSLLAFMLAPPLAGEDRPNKAEYQEDRLLVIPGQPFGEA